MEKDFEKFMSQLAETNATLDFYSDFKKIRKNVNDIAISLNMLNFLLGKEDLRSAVEALWERDKTVFNVLDILIATRRKDKKKFIDTDGQIKVISSLFTSVDGVLKFFEDTGLADPYALSVVESCAAAFDRVGLPEGRYHLAHATLYLATAPKSNSSLAFFDALSAVEKEDAEVPNHLKDGNRDAEGFGHGSGYMYPHAYKDHWVPQQYLPDTLSGRVFYNPSDQGYEKTIKEEVLSRRELQIAA